MYLALIGGVSSAMGYMSKVFIVAFFGIADLAAVLFFTWMEPKVSNCRLGMIIVESIL